MLAMYWLVRQTCDQEIAGSTACCSLERYDFGEQVVHLFNMYSSTCISLSNFMWFDIQLLLKSFMMMMMMMMMIIRLVVKSLESKSKSKSSIASPSRGSQSCQCLNHNTAFRSLIAFQCQNEDWPEKLTSYRLAMYTESKDLIYRLVRLQLLLKFYYHSSTSNSQSQF